MKTTTKLMGLVTVALCAAANQSQADVIYDSLATEPVAEQALYNTGTAPTTRWLAQSFNLFTGGSVANVVISMINNAQDPAGNVNVELWSNVGGVPGALLTTFTPTGSHPNPVTGHLDYTYTGPSAHLLGASYWVVMEPLGGIVAPANYLWDQNGNSASVGTGIGWAQYNGSAWQVVGTEVQPLELQVNGTIDVPEPGVMLTNAVILSAIGFGGFYYRRRAAAKA